MATVGRTEGGRAGLTGGGSCRGGWRQALGRQAGRQQASAAPGPWGELLPTTNKEGGAGSNAGLERVLAASWCGIEAQPRSWMLLSVRPPPPPPAVPGRGRQQTRKQAHTVQRPMLRGGIAQFFVGLWLGPEEEEGLGCPCLRGSRTPLRRPLPLVLHQNGGLTTYQSQEGPLRS